MITPCPTHGVPCVLAAPPVRLRRTSRRTPRRRAGCPPCGAVVPGTLARAAWAPSCGRGRRGGFRRQQQRGGCRTRAHAGANALAWGSVASLAPGARVQCGQVAPRPVSWHARRLLPCMGACRGSRWRPSGSQGAPCSSSARPTTGASHSRVVVPGPTVPSVLCPAACHRGRRPLPWSTGRGGLWQPGWCTRGGRRSVTGSPGHPPRSPATQQGLAGDRQ